MKFKDFLAEANKLAEEYPEALEMDVFQTSCFDDPYRFETSGAFIGQLVAVKGYDGDDGDDGTPGPVDIAHFSNLFSAEERLREEFGFDENIEQSEWDKAIQHRDVVVIEAF